MEVRRWSWVAAGIVGGVLLGFSVGGMWPQSVYAVATHGGEDNFAACTVPLDDDVEAVFLLDPLTGELKGRVINVQTRKFNTAFEARAFDDLPAPGVKNPQYRIVSGAANIRQNVVAGTLARSVIYVAEVTSGQLIAYGIPWVPGRASAVLPARAALIPIDRWQFRTAVGRTQ